MRDMSPNPSDITQANFADQPSYPCLHTLVGRTVNYVSHEYASRCLRVSRADQPQKQPMHLGNMPNCSGRPMQLPCLVSIYASWRKQQESLYECIHATGASNGRGELHKS